MSIAMKLASVQVAPGPFRRMVVTTVSPGAVEFARQIMLQVHVYNLQFHIKPANSLLSMAKKCLISDDKARCCFPSDSLNEKAQSIKTHPQSCQKDQKITENLFEKWLTQRYQQRIAWPIGKVSNTAQGLALSHA
jgi:hypothetical protein